MSSTVTVTLDETTVLPEGMSYDEAREAFAAIDQLDDVSALFVLMNVPASVGEDMPGPEDVATIQDALKALTLKHPKAVATAATDAALDLLEAALSDAFGLDF